MASYLGYPPGLRAGGDDESGLSVELGWDDAEAGLLGSGVQAPVPGGDDKIGVADGQLSRVSAGPARWR